VSDIPLDAVGVQHERAGARLRIVSLVPGITELLFELDLDHQIAGRTQYCVHPEGKADKLPSIGGTNKINMDRLRDLRPSHVILNMDENTQDLAREIKTFAPNLIVTHQMMPRDNLELFRLLGGIFHQEQKAEQLCTVFDKTLREVSAAAREWPERRVIYFIGKDPWTTVSQNTYISRMLDLVRWRTVGDDKRVRYPKLKITKSLLSKTDILLYSTEPFQFNKDDVLDFQEEYDCVGKPAHLIDGQMVSWYGSRSIKGLSYLQNFVQENH
jgi:ABC-type Fe3+-hydroxamate transport system substrate-binding protein